MKVVFISRGYNDIDHNSPIIERLLETNYEVLLLNISKKSLMNDFRVKHNLNRGLELVDKSDILNWKGKLLLRLPYAFLLCHLIGKILDPEKLLFKIDLFEKKISCVIFDWGTPFSRGFLVEYIFRKSFFLGIPKISFPHGMNIFSQGGLNNGVRKKILWGKRSNMSPAANLFDIFVVQSERHASILANQGYDHLKLRNLGAPRFSEHWRKTLQKITPKIPQIVNRKQKRKKLKIVYMEYQIGYVKNKGEEDRLLQLLDKDDRIDLIVKAATRENRSSKVLAEKSLRVGSEWNSIHLIDWADIVISAGSSIGVEAVLQGKILISPSFVIDVPTILTETGLAITLTKFQEISHIIDRFSNYKTLNEFSHDISALRILYSVFQIGPNSDPTKNYIDLIREVSDEI